MPDSAGKNVVAMPQTVSVGREGRPSEPITARNQDAGRGRVYRSIVPRAPLVSE